MKQHLSSEEISRWMIGERTPGQERHREECAECNAEIQRVERAFSLFRESGRRWADHWYQYSDARPDPGRLSSRWNRLTLAGAAGAMVMVAVLLLHSPLPHHSPGQAFVRVPYVAPPAPYERTEIIRMEVPVATLLAAGLEVHAPAVEGAVRADVVIGQDGRALAIRLVPD